MNKIPTSILFNFRNIEFLSRVTSIHIKFLPERKHLKHWKTFEKRKCGLADIKAFQLKRFLLPVQLRGFTYTTLCMLKPQSNPDTTLHVFF